MLREEGRFPDHKFLFGRSPRAEIRAGGIHIDDRTDPRDCDTAAKCLAYGLANRQLATPLPEVLLDSLDTFEDLVHYANLRNQQEGRGPVRTV